MDFSSHFRITTVALLALFTGPALAGEPVEVPQTGNQIMLGIDEARIYRFDETIARVEMPKPNVVEAIPRSQTELSLSGLSVGQTPIFVIGADGRRIWSGTVVVSQAPGHPVRIYRPASAAEVKAAGNRSDGKVDAADEYWCSSIKCSDVVNRK